MAGGSGRRQSAPRVGSGDNRPSARRPDGYLRLAHARAARGANTLRAQGSGLRPLALGARRLALGAWGLGFRICIGSGLRASGQWGFRAITHTQPGDPILPSKHGAGWPRLENIAAESK